MATELCPECGKWGTPWSYSKELEAHICADCFYKGREISEIEESQ